MNRKNIMSPHITTGSVFDDLGFSPAEANSLKIRALLMNILDTEINDRNLTQKQAAQILGIKQPRVSNLRQGKIQTFTIDSLIEMLGKLDKHVHLVIDDRLGA